jgi:hypothetical protein
MQLLAERFRSSAALSAYVEVGNSCGESKSPGAVCASLLVPPSCKLPTNAVKAAIGSDVLAQRNLFTSHCY